MPRARLGLCGCAPPCPLAPAAGPGVLGASRARAHSAAVCGHSGGGAVPRALRLGPVLRPRWKAAPSSPHKNPEGSWAGTRRARSVAGYRGVRAHLAGSLAPAAATFRRPFTSGGGPTRLASSFTIRCWGGIQRTPKEGTTRRQRSRIDDRLVAPRRMWREHVPQIHRHSVSAPFRQATRTWTRMAAKDAQLTTHHCCRTEPHCIKHALRNLR